MYLHFNKKKSRSLYTTFVFHYSACDLNSAMVLSVIGETDIDNAEKYIREHLLNILHNKTSKKLSKAEKALIFGKNHAKSPNTFCFTPGERILIRRISEYLKKNTLEQFSEKIARENYSTEKTILTSLGTIFGNENDLRLNTELTDSVTITNAKESLLQRASDKLKEFNTLVPVELTEDMILVDDSDPSRIKGQVTCGYCRVHISKVSAKYSKSSYSWVLSNLTTHLKNCQKANQTKKENEAKPKIVSSAAEDVDIIEVQVDLSDEEDAEIKPLSSELKKQMYIQDMKMRNSIVQNNETKTECEVNFGVGDSVISAIIDVINIPADGDCVFSAVTHQLYGKKIGSLEHDEKTQELRLRIVDHIRNNISVYTHVLKGRVYEKYGKIGIHELSDRFNQYLEDLSLKGHWSGNESLMAISDMLQKNIVIFNEKIDANMVASFDTNKRETIMLAFRLKNQSLVDLSNVNRNHYDSVVAINSDDILKETSRSLIKKQVYPRKKETSMIVID